MTQLKNEQLTGLNLPGIHHVTAFAGDPQQNYDFYAELLGLRLIKVTINYDDPSVYHTYYGDYAGTPGTALTFFPMPNAIYGRHGMGQVAVTQFAVPKGSLSYWYDRLILGLGDISEPFERLGDMVISFSDPDGMKLEIVEPLVPEMRTGFEGGPVPAQHTLRGFHGVTLASADVEASREQLEKVMGFTLTGQTDQVLRFQASGGEVGSVADLLIAPQPVMGRMGAGVVHHVAWRTPDDDQQLGWRTRLIESGVHVTGVRDRQYFHSIYSLEPGGILYEIATEGPGFGIDESLEALGLELKLPSWLEPRRNAVRSKLPSFKTRDGVQFP